MNSFLRFHFSLTLLLTGLGSGTAIAATHTFLAGLELQTRYFFEAPQFEEQHSTNFSTSIQPNYSLVWGEERNLLSVEPFFRWDQGDPARTHFDMRELSYVRSWDNVEVGFGIRKVFWGVAEFRNIVDIINQEDLVEDISGKEKLGQPMVNGAWTTNMGVFEVYLMSYFRERTFPSVKGRLRTEPIVNPSLATFQSSRDLDFATRWSHSMGIFDIGVSYFNGTARRPVFVVTETVEATQTTDGVFELAPFYDLINQASIDVQATIDSLLLKSEVLVRNGAQSENDHYALMVGQEYTFGGCVGLGCELGILLEYYYNSNGINDITGFQNDIFGGLRIGFNDYASSNLVIGAMVDTRNLTTMSTIDFSAKLSDNWEMKIRGIGFHNIGVNNDIKFFKDDSYVQMSFTRYFGN